MPKPVEVIEQEHVFEARGGVKLRGRSFSAAGQNRPGVLFISGAKPTSYTASDDFNDLRRHLCRQGINSFIYDVAGYGLSDADPKGDSLAARRQEAEAALHVLQELPGANPDNICLIGTSMGGHVAALLAAEHSQAIKGNVFLNAAAYSAEAEEQSFGPNFSETIRKPEAWRTSRVFPALRAASLPTLVIYGDGEEVVPEDIRLAIIEACGAKVDTFIVPNATHFFLSGRGGARKLEGQERADFFARIATFLQRVLLSAAA